MEQAISYFREAEKILDANEFETQEDFDTFLQNVFSEVDGMEKRLSMHHDGSMILEKLLNAAAPFHLRVFFERVSGEMAKLATHRYASHVMETVLKRAEYHFKAGTAGLSDETEGLASLAEMVVRLSGEIGASFDQVVFKSWGSHVYRKLISILQLSQPGFKAELETIFENISLSETEFLRGLCFDQFASPALQSVIQAAKGSSHLPQIIDKLLGNLEQSSSFVLKAASNECASYAIEALVKSMDSATFLSFYLKAVHPSFQSYLEGTPANFVIQHLISACHNEAQIGIILADLKPFLADLVRMKRAGILVRLVQWSAEHSGKAEDDVLTAVSTAFHAKSTADKKRLFELALHLETEPSDSTFIAPLGCNLLSQIARLSEQSVKPFVDNLLDLETVQLEALATHSQGSRVIEAFIVNGKISEKASSRLVRKLQGRIGALAADKCASHVIEKLWAASKVDQKNLIMAELVAAKKRLEDSAHGRLVLRNCRVADYERRQEEWVREEQSIERKRGYFADILGEDGQEKAKKPSKKKKRSSEESLMLTEDKPRASKLQL